MPPRIRQIPTPLIGIDPRTVMPRQPGESTYDYRFRRSVTSYGQTPYERRIWLAQQRGIGRSAARGHAARGGITETQSRTQRTLEQTGLTPSVLYRNTLRGWLTDHGYTPDATGMNWTALMKLGPRIRWMYNAAGSDQGRVLPEDILEAIEFERDNFLPPGWAYNRIWDKYNDMVAYREYLDKAPGNMHWAEFLNVHPYLPSLTPAWWYYH
jgi:hypothetical protein